MNFMNGVNDMRVEQREYKYVGHVYIADDGTEFNNKYDCQQYETNEKLDALRNSKNVLVCPSLTGCPFNGLTEYDDSEYKYMWLKALNADGVKEINGILIDDIMHDAFIGKWVCLEYEDGFSEDGIFGAGVSELEASLKYAMKVYSTIKKFDPEMKEKFI